MSENLNKSDIGRENVLRESEEIGGVKIEGYDFDKGVNYENILESYSSMGGQASHFSRAVKIINKMVSEKAFIYLGYTSSMVSSGLRDIFRWLIQEKKINVVVTTGGGIEEDIIKCLGEFYLGSFDSSGKNLRKKGINRIGNIFVANNRYVEFENFFQPVLEEMWVEQKNTGKLWNPSEVIWKLGEKINNKNSICYWAWKNKIKIYCPSILDGALGDNIYFFKSKHPDFKIEVSEDLREINDSTIGLKKSGVIILGSGIVKHHILNANLFRNGADYAVYLNDAQESNISDAGASPEEAISWGKILPDALSIKLFGDALLLFPLIVARTFARD